MVGKLIKKHREFEAKEPKYVGTSASLRFDGNLLVLVTIGQSQEMCWDCLFLMKCVA